MTLNRTIDKHLGARFLQIQPGDGTRYTIMLSSMNTDGSYFVAIGPGDSVSGGYWVRQTSLNNFMMDIKEYLHIDTNTRFGVVSAITEHHYVNYWTEHTNIKNLWTSAVAIISAWVMLTYQEQSWPTMLRLSGLLYNGKAEASEIIDDAIEV